MLPPLLFASGHLREPARLIDESINLGAEGGFGGLALPLIHFRIHFGGLGPVLFAQRFDHGVLKRHPLV